MAAISIGELLTSGIQTDNVAAIKCACVHPPPFCCAGGLSRHTHTN